MSGNAALKINLDLSFEDEDEDREERALLEALEEQAEEQAEVEAAMKAPSLADELEEEEPDQRPKRRKRRSRARARTISIRRLSKAELRRGRLLYPETDYWKPSSRTECKDMERPCPYVSCKYHLYIDVHPVRGSIKLNFPDLEVWEMTETCALDVADKSGITLEEVGEIMNLTRERVRQVETTGLAKLAAIEDIGRLKDYISVG
jgi:DNA-directed RNA polymerase sigma subunit (sigma70/sigma32)